MKSMAAHEDAIRKQVRKRYAKAAAVEFRRGATCCAAGYSSEELSWIPAESLLGLGSGNPVRHANLRPGEVVVDLGSGAGVDVFLAARIIRARGHAIGIDMTPGMVQRARQAAAGSGLTNVEFREGLIERLPLPDGIADVVLSNCVINLSPDNPAVFREAFRILRSGGRLVVSDVVQERPLGEIDDDCGCVATALIRGEYLETIRGAGFRSLEILEDRPWRYGPNGVDASAITLRAMKPGEKVRA